MGICLDTEQNNGSDVGSEAGDGVEGARRDGARGWEREAVTPPTGKFPMQNDSHVQFETPRVPVVFVLGGPGSGKVTHCDNLMQEKRGLVHINMTDLLQQYAIGNDMQDFGTLSSKTVTEVLMLEMKMAPSAKTYLVSGYPRSMRDVAEYSDKIKVVNGVILISWRKKVLERQIDYGAKLGHVVLSLAKMELKNFYKNVMPVAEYFDQSNMLITVNGERNPGDVYKDFRDATLAVLSSLDPDMFGAGGASNGVTGNAIEPALTVIAAQPPMPPPLQLPLFNNNANKVIRVRSAHMDSEVAAGAVGQEVMEMHTEAEAGHKARAPAVVWVIGGPGSNKAALCSRVVANANGWAHFSLGQRLRTLADSGGQVGSDAAVARTSLAAGEMAPHGLVARLVREALSQHGRRGEKGVLIDGYPRDMQQVEEFELEHKQQPHMVLLDCSKLQLGRGRRDDSVAAFRRRLELFRELSLPMLKTMDAAERLFIVDGDTDSLQVQEEFSAVLLEQMRLATMATGTDVLPPPPAPLYPRAQPLPPPAPATEINTISSRVSAMANGGVRHAATYGNGNVTAGNGLANGHVANGYAGINTAKVAPSTLKLQEKINSLTRMNTDSLKNLYQRPQATNQPLYGAGDRHM